MRGKVRPMALQGEQEKIFRTLRLTELPRRRYLEFLIGLFKTLEVLIFKGLQVLDLYRPQKSIVGIPSLATQSFTLLQALVYNGTQDEVLGFRPRRLFHRVLRGLPDLEAFERVRFQFALNDTTVRSIETSTETRGYVNLQLPWQMPANTPGKAAWLRLIPSGVDTMLGTIKLGDYEIYSSPIFYLNDKVKWIIFSDIDDTIKDSNIAETTGVKAILSAIFKGHYYTYQPIDGMAELYQQLVAQGALIVYVTSTPYQLAPFLLKFLRQAGFPDGPVFPRWLGYGKFGHKFRIISKVMAHTTTQKCFLIGDSGEQDLPIYRRLAETPEFRDKVAKVLIRHVPGSPLPKDLHDRELIYHSLEELKTELARVIS